MVTIFLGIDAARDVLGRAGDADGDVELRAHDLARLSDLHAERHPVLVHGDAGGSDHAAEKVRQFLDHLETRHTAESAASGHDDLGVFELDAFCFLLHGLEESSF